MAVLLYTKKKKAFRETKWIPAGRDTKPIKLLMKSIGLALLFALTLNILTLQYISRPIKQKQCFYDIFSLTALCLEWESILLKDGIGTLRACFIPKPTHCSSLQTYEETALSMCWRDEEIKLPTLNCIVLNTQPKDHCFILQ